MGEAEAWTVDGRNALEVARSLPCAKRDVFYHVRALTLRAQVTCAGRERHAGGDGYDWHGLRRGAAEFVCFQYTIAGAGRLRWERTTYELVPGTAMLLSIPHDHRYWLPEGGHWDFLWICLVGHEVQAAWRAVQAQHGPVLDLARHGGVLAAAVRAVRTVLGDEGPSAYRASALAYELAMSLDEVAASAPGLGPRHAGIERAARHCREHLAEDVTVTALARLAGLSRHHFTRRFRAAYGKGPKEYHTALRIQHAAERLRDGAQVKDVARDCGFADPTYFCKVFRRVVGMSPGGFRDGGMFMRAQT